MGFFKAEKNELEGARISNKSTNLKARGFRVIIKQISGRTSWSVGRP